MTNWDLYNLINYIVNKDVYAQAISPPEFDLELKSKNLKHFRKRLGLPEAYIPGSANVGAGVTRVTDTDLLPFLVEETKNPVGGVITLLDTWYYILDFYTSASISSEIINIQEVSSRLNNYITKPALLHLAAYCIPQGLRIYPAAATGVTVIYYRRPVDPVFATDTNPVTLVLEYDAVNSVELEWDDGSKLDILSLILQDMGLNIERQDVVQMAAKMVETGK